jgi:hypothetical protein
MCAVWKQRKIRPRIGQVLVLSLASGVCNLCFAVPGLLLAPDSEPANLPAVPPARQSLDIRPVAAAPMLQNYRAAPLAKPAADIVRNPVNTIPNANLYQPAGAIAIEPSRGALSNPDDVRPVLQFHNENGTVLHLRGMKRGLRVTIGMPF